MPAKPSTNKCDKHNSMINRHIGTAYATVKIVADNIEIIEKIGDNLPYLLKYLGAYSTPPTQRPDGTPLQDGDYYFDSVSETLVYYKLATDEWFEVDPQEILNARDEAISARDAAQLAQANAETAEANAEASESNAAQSVIDAQLEASNAQAQADRSEAEADRAEQAALTSANSIVARGVWDASSGNFPTPTLTPLEKADWYRISVAGTMSDSNPLQPDVSVEAQDNLYWDPIKDIWYAIRNLDLVRSVDGQQGDVVIDKYTQAEVDNLLIPLTQGVIATGSTELRNLSDRFADAVNVKDFGAIGDGVADDTDAIQAALDYATGGDGVNGLGYKVYLPAGRYSISATLKIASLTHLCGDGRWESDIRASDSFVGDYLLEDKGSASKIHLTSLRFQPHPSLVIESVIRLGYTIPFGTEGLISDIMISAGDTTNFWARNGLDIVGNVGLIQYVSCTYARTAFFEGSNSTANSYVGCVSLGSKLNDMNLGTNVRVLNHHCEAPFASCIPFLTRRTGTYAGISVSLGEDNVNHIFELEAAAIGINVSGMSLLESGTGRATNIIKDLRPISASDINWADKTNLFGNFYSFADSGYTRVGLGGLDYNSAETTAVKLTADSSTGKSNVAMEFTGGAVDSLLKVGDSRAYPTPDNALSLGFAGGRWTEVFAVNGTINTSDEREKVFYEVEAVEKQCALELKSLIKKFKWNDAVAKKGEDGARIHFGVGAQTVRGTFVKHGLDPDKYSLFCYDNTEGEGLYGIRYTELAMFILSAI